MHTFKEAHLTLNVSFEESSIWGMGIADYSGEGDVADPAVPVRQAMTYLKSHGSTAIRVDLSGVHYSSEQARGYLAACIASEAARLGIHVDQQNHMGFQTLGKIASAAPKAVEEGARKMLGPVHALTVLFLVVQHNGWVPDLPKKADPIATAKTEQVVATLIARVPGICHVKSVSWSPTEPRLEVAVVVHSESKIIQNNIEVLLQRQHPEVHVIVLVLEEPIQGKPPPRRPPSLRTLASTPKMIIDR